MENADFMAFALSKLKEEDLDHRGFLKPLEIQLKTYKTEQGVEGSKLKPSSLPAGLKIAHKDSILNNKYELQNVTEIDKQSNYSILKQLCQDNILTLMKEKAGIELAICICMYSEDKKMLKYTIAGVKKNFSNIVARGKVSPDKIAVIVTMDGIEKIHQSIHEYFEELELESNINLGDNIASALPVEEMIKRSKTMTQVEIHEMEMKNVNNFLFDPAELQDRNQRRFSSVHAEYKSIKTLQKTIEKLRKENPLYDDLPYTLRTIFINEVRQEYKKDYAQTDQNVKNLPEQRLLAEYGTDIRKIRPLIIKTLNVGERYCHQYINSREDLAYLASFRIKVRHDIDKLHKRDRKQDYKQQDAVELLEDAEQNDMMTTMNLFMCVKYKNSGKLSSQNWFFNGFCKELRPNYAVLLDVGLKPQDEALYKMYNYMKSNTKVGGVCGYMSLKLQKIEQSDEIKDNDVDFLTNLSLKFADIQRTQQVQYHFAHLMDKPFEAFFGFIHVLPGAFSAYNMKAIMTYDSQDDELLKAYFKSIDEKVKKNNKVLPSSLTIPNVLLRVLLPDMFNSSCLNIHPESQEQMLYNQNIYLAEDRILCMGIHTKGFDMIYLPDAYAEVDPIKTVHDLLGQRKRWINGSFFAFEKVKKELGQHQKKNGLQCLLHIQMIYLTLMNALSYFAPAFFLFTFHIAMQAFRADVLPHVFEGMIQDPNQNQFYNGFVYTMDFIYVVLILSVIFFSLHLKNNDEKFKPHLYAVSTLFGIFSIVVFAVLAVDVIRGLADNSAFLIENQKMTETVPGGMDTINALRWILIGTTLVYIIPILTYAFLFERLRIIWDIIKGAFSFLFYGPTYLIILNIYSLCRIDDISWGTKGLDAGAGGQSSKLKDSWKLIKFIHVSKYVIWNIIVGAVILSLGSSYTPRFFITIIMVGIMGFSLSAKIFIGLIYMIKYKLSICSCCEKEQKPMKPMQKNQSRIQNIMKKYKKEITGEVQNILKDMKMSYQNNPVFKKGGSYIQAAKSEKNVEKSFQKLKKQNGLKSKIIPKINGKMTLANSKAPSKNFLQTIKQEELENSPKKKGLPSISPINDPHHSDKSYPQSPEKTSLVCHLTKRSEENLAKIIQETDVNLNNKKKEDSSMGTSKPVQRSGRRQRKNQRFQ